MSYLGQAPGLGEAERFIFTASGSETSVTADDNGVLINYTVGQVSVYLNGVKLVLGTDFTATNGSTITGLAALTAADVVEIIALSTFSPADTVPATGGTFSGNVTHSGTVTNSSTTTHTGAVTNSSTTTTTGDATHNGNIIMATNKKVQQKGAFMQHSTNQALVLGG